MEEFFMDSLEHVKGEMRKDKSRELKRIQEKYKQSMKDVPLRHLVLLIIDSRF